MTKTLKLKRAVGLTALTLYGLGNILGAGIYVLIGKVAEAAGYAAPLSFLIALVVAALTAFSYMELTSRYPKTAAVPVYLHQAFGRPLLSTGIGLLLVGAGLVSAATLVRGFVGYLSLFVNVPEWAAIIGVIGALAVLAVAGIAHSTRLAGVFTVIEVGGLLLVVGSSLKYLPLAPQVMQNLDWAAVFAPGVAVGAFLAFYAFIGFEDMVEVVEEVKNPLRTMPRAIFLSLILSTVLYLLVVLAALLVKTPQQLAASSAPLADVFAAASGGSPLILAAIGLAAIVNGILVHIIMGSRVLYGLAAQGWIDKSFGEVRGDTRTPATATITIATIIMALALLFPLVRLAEFTSFLVLFVFGAVNAALLVIKRKHPKPEGYQVNRLVPVFGFLTAGAMLVSAFLLL